MFRCSGPAPSLSSGVRNLTGSGINKRKANQAELQRAFGRHGGSGAACRHKEPSVSRLVLRIPVEYSLSHTLPHTHSRITRARKQHILSEPTLLFETFFFFIAFSNSCHKCLVTGLAFRDLRWENITTVNWNCCELELQSFVLAAQFVRYSNIKMYILPGNCLFSSFYLYRIFCTLLEHYGYCSQERCGVMRSSAG